VQIGSHPSRWPEAFEVLLTGTTEEKHKVRVKNMPPVPLQLRW
jgi:hypothetical protein